MRTSEKTIHFRGNLSLPGVKTVLKIKRYAQRLSHRVCMGDGGSWSWAPVKNNGIQRCIFCADGVNCRLQVAGQDFIWIAFFCFVVSHLPDSAKKKTKNRKLRFPEVYW